MASVVERTRLLHQDLERLEKQMVQDMLQDTTTHKALIERDHRIKARLDKYMGSANKLLELYDDKDKIRQAELKQIAGANAYGVFLDRVKSIREYHRDHPNAGLVGPTEDDVETPEIAFTGEEWNGRFVDMYQLFERYINLRHGDVKSDHFFERVEYIKYLEVFHKFDHIPKSKKLAPHFIKLLQDTLDYLVSFHQRVSPLVATKQIMDLIESDFDKLWTAKKLPGWGDAKDSDVDMTAKEDAAKLHCDVCMKSFSKASVMKGHMNSKKHKKRAAASNKQGAALAKRKRELQFREVALLELKIAQYRQMLSQILEATQQHLERKQTMNPDEIAAQLMEQDEPTDLKDDDSDDDEKVPYNPHNVPLGWDGKPIPYWLFKLHGLNIEYKCEICGNYSYRGPRAFQRHFQEARHAYGMRCLGIPNTKHFHNITAIQDAVALHEKIKKKSEELAFDPEDEEEFEDEDGNVFNKKTYQDLKRQGLL